MYNIDSLVARLKGMADEKYRKFNEGLIPGTENTSLGVRLPMLRALAKEILREDWLSFLDASRSHPVFEARMLHGIVLGSAKCGIEERIDLIEAFLPFINNWAVCDTFCSTVKPSPADKEIFFPFVCRCAASDMEYRKRFGLVMMIQYYREDRWADDVFCAYSGFRHEGYYARMAAAWGLATLYIFHKDRVLEIIRSNTLDRFTHNKAIQKMIESYRISDEDKQMLRALRRNREK